MKLVAGCRPPHGEAVGTYGSSRVRTVGAWTFVTLAIVDTAVTGRPEPAAWMRVADLAWLGFWVLIACLLTFTPRLTIGPAGFKRRLSTAICWDEVVDVVRPSLLTSSMRVRLHDRTMIELAGVTPDRADAVDALVRQGRLDRLESG